MIGTVGAGAVVASRFLLWDSARGAKLFEQRNTNPMLEVTRHFGWLMARSKKHLRARPESIELVGREDLDAVPEELRVLFGDAALRMIVKSDFGADVIRSCCGASIPATDR
jgi:hypothetical protein